MSQLNYNLHTDEGWKGNSRNGSNKDNAGSGSSSGNCSYPVTLEMVTETRVSGNSSANNGKEGDEMSLCHEFAIIENNNSENFIDANMNAVSISDEIILYIKDSLYWIDTWWNGKKKKGLRYYGYTRIEDKNIGKLICILEAWIALFKMAPEKFVLTGNYLLEEDKYEENLFTKKELLQQLKALKTICIDAVNQNMDILHNGI